MNNNELDPILLNLNDAQRKVVSAPFDVDALVLAGAGSGKTTALVSRIAWFLREGQVSPIAILAVTFTNKAARELKARIETLLQYSIQGMWVGTFHGLAHRLLRENLKAANLSASFQILDADDQYRLIRRLLKTLSLDEERFSPKRIQSFINSKKDEGLRPQHIETGLHPDTQVMVEVYHAYEQACAKAELVDFAELLLRAHEILRDNPPLLLHYQQHFKYILVDEFQDTNAIQYAWLKLLCGQDNHIMVVGDDDQSIYGWRGARIENIQRFRSDFPSAKTFLLEQNYRSTNTILLAANALIAKNEARLENKSLWTAHGEGDLITIYKAFNEMDEARFIVDTIQQLGREGVSRKDCAVLYRSNAQSRVLEEVLLDVGMPYRIYGGQRFFERAEIKDGLAYLRLLVNRHDDAAFERVVNVPARGIGAQTLLLLRDYARSNEVSLWQTAVDLLDQNQLSARMHSMLLGFLQLIDVFEEETKMLSLGDQAEQVLRKSGLFELFAKEKSEKAQNRVENLEELITATKHFVSDDTSLSAFLSYTALEGQGQDMDNEEEVVQLMTLHAAKGLEFPVVFICGMEEGLFPHQMSVNRSNFLEEERRLCYVGITRAMKKLYLSYAETRRLHGLEVYNAPSRFITELPRELLTQLQIETGGSIQKAQKSLPKSPSRKKSRLNSKLLQTKEGFCVGQTVRHPKFGEGIILNIEGQAQHARVQVQFRNGESKWLVTQFAKLEIVYTART